MNQHLNANEILEKYKMAFNEGARYYYAMLEIMPYQNKYKLRPDLNYYSEFARKKENA